MIRSRELKAQMILHGDTTADIAAALGVTRRAVYGKLSGATRWTADQIRVIADRYGLTPEQICQIFMTDK